MVIVLLQVRRSQCSQCFGIVVVAAGVASVFRALDVGISERRHMPRDSAALTFTRIDLSILSIAIAVILG